MNCSWTTQRIHMRDWGVSRSRVWCEWDGFHVLGTLDEAPVTFQSSGVRADAQWSFHMARITCFRKEYYTGMREYYSTREDSRPRPNRTTYANLMVFHWYLWIDQFVWAHALCGLRRGCLLGSGVPGPTLLVGTPNVCCVYISSCTSFNSFNSYKIRLLLSTHSFANACLELLGGFVGLLCVIDLRSVRWQHV